jgi:hypothetical protein
MNFLNNDWLVIMIFWGGIYSEWNKSQINL